MKKDLPREYEIGATRVGQAVQNAKVSISNLGVNCLIPIVGKRGAIGSTYRATGGAHGLGIHAPQVHDYGAHCQERTKQTA